MNITNVTEKLDGPTVPGRNNAVAQPMVMVNFVSAVGRFLSGSNKVAARAACVPRITALLVLVLLAGCATGQKFVPAQNRDIHKIALLTPQNRKSVPSGSINYILVYPPTPGIVGMVSTVTHFSIPETFAMQVNAALQQEKLDPAAEFTDLLVRDLRAQGYEVVTIDMPRTNTAQSFVRYDGIETDADAILDVAFVAIYRDGAIASFEPTIGVRARLLHLPDQQVRMDAGWSYGAFMPMGIARAGEFTVFSSDPNYRFDSAALLGNPQRAAEGMRIGLRLLATHVADAVHQ
jgi:hypothetical protein